MPKSEEQQKIINRLRSQVGEDFLVIKLKIDGKIFKANIVEQMISFSTDDDLALQMELIKQPAMFAKYGMIWAEAKKKLKALKRTEHDFRSSKRQKVFSLMIKESKESKIRKAPTKEDIEARIDTEYKEDVLKHRARIDKWEDIVQKLEIIMDAWKQRAFALSSDTNILTTIINQGAIQPKTRNKF